MLSDIIHRGRALRIVIEITILILLLGGAASAADYNLSLGTWTGIIDQGGNIYNSLDFDVSKTGTEYAITRYHTQIQCYDYRAYWVSIFRNNIYVPIINNSFNYFGEFRGTFTSPVNASGNFDISAGSCRASGRWWATPTPIPSITVVSPNGGENWTRGNTMAINWSSHGSTGANVSIELLKDGVPSIINSSTPNDGSYNWAIQFSQIPGPDYKIRVTSTTNSAFNDTSDNNFTISDLAPKTGDINGDGQLTLVDAIYLAKHVGGFSGYETIYADGDINGNGQVTLVDAIYLAKHVGGFIGYEKIY